MSDQKMILKSYQLDLNICVSEGIWLVSCALMPYFLIKYVFLPLGVDDSIVV